MRECRKIDLHRLVSGLARRKVQLQSHHAVLAPHESGLHRHPTEVSERKVERKRMHAELAAHETRLHRLLTLLWGLMKQRRAVSFLSAPF